MKKIRLLSFVLALVLLCSNNICTVPALAAGRPGVTAKAAAENRNARVEITEIEITGVDEPVAGQRFAAEATVRAYKDGVDIGVSWKIPVMWIDENGKAAVKAEYGKRYTPVFVFYVPDGYELKGVDFNRFLNVKLPDFLSAPYVWNNSNRAAGTKGDVLSDSNTNRILSVTDPASGITYIKGNIVVPKNEGVNNTGTEAGRFYVNGILTDNAGTGISNTGNGSTVNNNADNSNPGSGSNNEGNNNDDDHKDNDEESYAAEQVVIHCSREAIDIYGQDFLAWFVGVIKDEIQPKAVNLIIDSFPSFQVDKNFGWFSENIGLYVYVDHDSAGVAAVNSFMEKGTYEGEDPNLFYVSMRMEYNAPAFVSKDQDGNWTINNKDIDALKQTTVHEMIHAFMFDYNRNGVFGMTEDLTRDKTRYALPGWLCEGAAEAAGGVYAGRILEYIDYYDLNSNVLKYTEEKLYNAYQDKSRDTSNLNGYGEYSMGTLAVFYLSGLSAQKYYNEDFSKLYYTDSYYYREGLEKILNEINMGRTLDSVINEISEGKYKDTADFESQFISSKSHDTTKACVALLNYFDSLTREDENGRFAYPSGSLLKEFGAYEKDLFEGVSGEKSVYKIADTGDFVRSTVDPDKAMHTGTKSAAATGNSNITAFPAYGTETERAAREVRSAENAPDTANSEAISSDADEEAEEASDKKDAGAAAPDTDMGLQDIADTEAGSVTEGCAGAASDDVTTEEYGSDSTGIDEVVSDSTGMAESGPADTGIAEAGPADTGIGEACPADTGTGEACPADAGIGEAGPADTGIAEAGPADTGIAEAGPADTGIGEACPADAGIGEACPADTGIAEACTEDTGVAEACPADTGIAETCTEDTGVAETGSDEAGSAEGGSDENVNDGDSQDSEPADENDQDNEDSGENDPDDEASDDDDQGDEDQDD